MGSEGKEKKVQALVLAASFFFLLARQRQENRLSSYPLSLSFCSVARGFPPHLQSVPSHPLVETADRPPTCSRDNSALPRDVWDEHLHQKQTKPHLLLVALPVRLQPVLCVPACSRSRLLFATAIQITSSNQPNYTRSSLIHYIHQYTVHTYTTQPSLRIITFVIVILVHLPIYITMPYNTRRKSLSLPSLGIHVPVTHASRAAASSKSTSRGASTSASATPAASSSRSESPDAHPNKRIKKSHAADTAVIETTPPPSPPRAISEEMPDADAAQKIDLESIKDDIVEAVVVQLQSTANRPHLIKELATVLMQSLTAVQQYVSLRSHHLFPHLLSRRA